MISPAVRTFLMLIPVAVAAVLLVAALGSRLPATTRRTLEMTVIRPLFLLLMLAGAAWMGWELVGDVTHKRDIILAVLHTAAFGVFVWQAVEMIRRWRRAAKGGETGGAA